ncbi:hypothetical protein A3726_03055 [Erythrobacter sp. HI0037]|nr:hypothetical protein A3719_04750 [Erythrobacter sp. HI0020]KZY18610.1 hypothetical protein A3727_03230 [Erythrobacter sp. HI0038]KZY28926.1 hypothetical protein A3726_03055 [Erythrobacter sp. HI0037]
MVGPEPLLEPGLPGWRMAGAGGFREVEPGTIESYGGSGIFWYTAKAYADFDLVVQWRVHDVHDNSGVFLRIPLLEDDPGPAIKRGYEIQIDERGINPEEGKANVPDRLTGAIYKLAPASATASHPVGAWNSFRIEACGDEITTIVNGTRVSRLVGGSRNREGYLGLQAHHEGSRVQFRAMTIAQRRKGGAAGGNELKQEKGNCWNERPFRSLFRKAKYSEK